MYHVLIVDDEKMVRNGVFETLSMAEELELNLLMAASAVEAMAIFERQKIDIAVMDINMPQMSGLELFDIVREKWPFCKVIFLTGYSEFDYVYHVQSHARYLLKAEDNEKIVQAVRDSIADIENDLLLEKWDESEKRRAESGRYESGIFLRDLLDGTERVTDETQSVLTDLEIQLTLSQKVYCVLLRLDGMEAGGYHLRQGRMRDVFLLTDKFYMQFMQGAVFEHHRNLIYCLLQPKKLGRQEHVLKMLEGNSALFQKALQKNLGVSATVLIGKQPLSFEQAITAFSAMNSRMAWMEREDLLISELRESTDREAGETLTEGEKNELTAAMQQLENSFDSYDEERIYQQLRRMRESVQKVESMHDLFVMELYCQIGARFLGAIKQLGLSRDIAFHIRTIDLYNASGHESWREAFTYLIRVAESLFALKKRYLEEEQEDVVSRIKHYILEHLSGDTSLEALSSYCGLSQEHMLRVFKKKEDVTILQYINELKISRAKEMLQRPEMQIKDIASALGFSSPGYFSRFFKYKMGMTPNAWRELQAGKGG